VGEEALATNTGKAVAQAPHAGAQHRGGRVCVFAGWEPERDSAIGGADGGDEAVEEVRVHDALHDAEVQRPFLGGSPVRGVSGVEEVARDGVVEEGMREAEGNGFVLV